MNRPFLYGYDISDFSLDVDNYPQGVSQFLVDQIQGIFDMIQVTTVGD